MTEVIVVLEKQIQEIRNRIAGTRDRITKGEENVEAETQTLGVLKLREIQFKKAIDSLKGK